MVWFHESITFMSSIRIKSPPTGFFSDRACFYSVFHSTFLSARGNITYCLSPIAGVNNLGFLLIPRDMWRTQIVLTYTVPPSSRHAVPLCGTQYTLRSYERLPGQTLRYYDQKGLVSTLHVHDILCNQLLLLLQTVCRGHSHGKRYILFLIR